MATHPDITKDVIVNFDRHSDDSNLNELARIFEAGGPAPRLDWARSRTQDALSGT